MNPSSARSALAELAADPDHLRSDGREQAVVASFLVFRLARTWYAFPAAEVKEVVPRSSPVPVPGTPGFVLGVAHVSGRIVVVLDLQTLLGTRARELEPADDAPLRDLVLLVDGLTLGVRVDEVAGLIEVDRSSLRALSAGDEKSPAQATFSEGARAVTVLSAARVAALAEARVGAS